MTDATETIRRRNPKEQGLIGLGDAISWFTRKGYGVLLPLNDSQKYDLVVEDPDGSLSRVQVKTSTYRSRYGSFAVDLRTNGGNQSRRTTRYFHPDDYEMLFALTDSGDRYLIPSTEITARGVITLGAKWEPYRVGPSGLPA